jgi:hypothetical protein
VHGVAAAASAEDGGVVLTGGGCHHRWHSLANCDHRDSITVLRCAGAEEGGPQEGARPRHDPLTLLVVGESVIGGIAAAAAVNSLVTALPLTPSVVRYGY